MAGNSITLDVRGLSCPEPVVRTKKYLDQGVSSLTVLTDSRVSMENIRRLAANSGFSFSSEAQNDEYLLDIRKEK
jgi:TusA-related sulfurtransferase